jgi:hypothetical protein
MLKEKTDSIWAMMTALFFVLLVIYLIYPRPCIYWPYLTTGVTYHEL